MKIINLIFVVETDDITQSDDAYFTWMLKNFYQKYLGNKKDQKIYIKYEFIHMGGKTNYNKPKIARQIRYASSLFKAAYKEGLNFVIYCFDVDRNGNKDTAFIGEVKKFCLEKQYKLVISYKEIESVFNIKNHDSKASKAKHFVNHYPKKTELTLKNFSVPFDKVSSIDGSTNFKIVIDSILDQDC